MIDQLRDPFAKTYRAQDDLKYQETKYLETLISCDENLTAWLFGIAAARDDRRALARNPRIRTVLDCCLSEARASLKHKLDDEAPFSFNLASPLETDRFCNHLVNLWNRMQAGWVVADKAIRSRMPQIQRA
jgi:hypothetical protein